MIETLRRFRRCQEPRRGRPELAGRLAAPQATTDPQDVDLPGNLDHRHHYGRIDGNIAMNEYVILVTVAEDRAAD